MVKCVVPGCDMRSKSDSENDVQFFPIPQFIEAGPLGVKERSEKRRRAWLLVINNDDLKNEFQKTTRKICSRHFISGQPAGLNEEDDPDWLPSLRMGSSSSSSEKNVTEHGTAKSGKKRRSGKRSVASSSSTPEENADKEDGGSDDMVKVHREDFNAMQEELSALRKHNADLKKSNSLYRSMIRQIRDITSDHDK